MKWSCERMDVFSGDPTVSDTGEAGLRGAVVIDECEFFRLAVVDILYREGYLRVWETQDFETAIRTGLPTKSALVIVSASACRPRHAGELGVQAARQRLEPRRLIVTTPVFSRPLALRILAEGAHGIVAKPLGAGDCARAIQAVTQGRIHVPAAIAELPWEPEADAAEFATPDEPSPPLTPRQRQVLERMAVGLSNKAIARDLGLGEGTIKIHVAALFRVLGVTNRTGAAIAGMRLLGRAATGDPGAGRVGAFS